MNNLYIVIILIFISAILIKLFRSKRNKAYEEKQSAINKSVLSQKTPLSIPEQKLYWSLIKALPEKMVLPQVAFSSFLVTNGKSKSENQSKRNSINQKVTDFVLCDKAFNILGIVELDDKSHCKKKDEMRDALLAEAGITVHRFNVMAMPSTEQLKNILA